MEIKQIGHAGATVLLGTALLVSAGSSLGETDEFEQLSVLETQELETVRGREGNSMVTVQSNQDLSATISGTAFTAGEINSGTVQLESGALDNFNGVGLFNFVTGNGNAIDAAIGVNIYLQ